MSGGSPTGGGRVTVAVNKKARRDYIVEERLEAGIELMGSEVKSLRAGRASIGEAYAAENHGEFFLVNAHIPEYAPSGRFGHKPKRERRLLLHRRQINRLAGLVQAAGKTVVPLRLFFNERGIAKIELAVATGKKAPDKRAALKEREWRRDRERMLKRRR
jgi:SsrA-binding protein